MNIVRFFSRIVLAGAIALVAGPALAEVMVMEPWVRGTVEGQTSSGAYMVIHSDKDVSLVGVRAEGAGSATLHEMMMHGDMMMMMPLERLAVSAGKPVALDEHKFHIMLDDLKHALKPGESVKLVLQFVDAKGEHFDLKVDAPVRPLSAHDEDHAAHDHHGMAH